MDPIASGFLFFYLGVTLAIVILCCNIIQANYDWCCCGCCGSQSTSTIDERMEEINQRIVVKKAESYRDFSLRRDSRLALRHGSNSQNRRVAIDDERIEEEHLEADEGMENDGPNDEETGTTSSNDETAVERKNKNKAGFIVSTFCEKIAPISRSNSVDPSRKCAICLDEYEIGDEICYSRNKTCPHVFHSDCMKNWLIKSNDCPLCRVNYLQAPGHEQGKRSRNATDISVFLPGV